MSCCRHDEWQSSWLQWGTLCLCWTAVGISVTTLYLSQADVWPSVRTDFVEYADDFVDDCGVFTEWTYSLLWIMLWASIWTGTDPENA